MIRKDLNKEVIYNSKPEDIIQGQQMKNEEKNVPVPGIAC